MRTFLRPRLSRTGKALVLVFGVAFGPPSVAASNGFFEGLGTLSGGEFLYSRPYDVSADGSVVVGKSQSAIGIEAFRWTRATGMVGLGLFTYPQGDYRFSSAFGVSADGSVIVGSGSSPAAEERGEPFRWTEATGMVSLGELPGGLFGGAAVDVSNDGSVVTGGSMSYLSPTFSEGFLWTEETGIVGLGVLPGSSSPYTIPTSISADGTVVVGHARTGNGREAFRWTMAEGLVALGDLPGPPFESFARSVSADGLVIVGLGVDVGSHAVRWTAETGIVDLGHPPGGYCSSAWDTSADGAIVVGDGCVGGDSVPAIWDDVHGARNLNDVLVELGLGPALAGWDLEEATAISDDGTTVVGWGYHWGEYEGWIARLQPAGAVEIPTASGEALALIAALVVAAGLTKLRLR